MRSGVWRGLSGERTAWAFVDVTDPLVAWLAYRGEMVSADETVAGALSIFHSRRLRNAGAALYDAELHLDRERNAINPLLPSRLRGFFAFPNKRAATHAAAIWGLPSFSSENLVEIMLHPNVRVAEHDSQYITRKLSGGPGPWMARYVRGETDEQGPWGRMPELVVEGRALILGTELRERAKETVLATWPYADSVLELGRIGAELGTDAGLITAWVATNRRRRVRFIMRDAEFRDPDFLDAFAQFRDQGNPIDWKALRSFMEGRARLPDLTPEEFDLVS
jgi:hypothetical protein